MNYKMNIWKDGDKITAGKLNNMERGIADASASGGTSTDAASSRIAFAVPSAGLEIEGGTVYGIGSCTDEHVVIPEFSPTGEKITAVADYAFGVSLGNDMKQIKSITFPPSIERIGAAVVHTKHCSNLEAVYIMNPFIKWRSNYDESTGDSAQHGMYLGPNVRNVFFGGSRNRWIELNASVECTLISITKEAFDAGMSPTVHYAHFITPPELKGAYTKEELDKMLDELKKHTIKNYATPQMYGANGDGKTDDTDAIQQCIDNSMYIFFPKGTYLISKTLEIPYGRTIIGANKYSTKITCGFGDEENSGTDEEKAIFADKKANFSNGIIHFKENAERIKISGLAFSEYEQISGEALSATYDRVCNTAIKIPLFTYSRNAVLHTFDDIWVRHVSGSYFLANGSGHVNNINIQNCSFERGGSDCIEFITHTSSQINNINIINSNITIFNGDGVVCSGQNINVTGCTIQVTRTGVNIDPARAKTKTGACSTQGVTITGNYFEQQRRSYISMNPFYNSETAQSGFIVGVSISGNYGAFLKGVPDTDENGKVYPAIEIKPNTIMYAPKFPKGGTMVSGVFYAGNNFGVIRNTLEAGTYEKVLFDGGGILQKESVIVADGEFGNVSAFNNPPYTLKNMNNATVISHFTERKDIMKLREGFVKGEATISDDFNSITLSPSAKLCFNLKTKGINSIEIPYEITGKGADSEIQIYGYGKTGTRYNMASYTLSISSTSTSITANALQTNQNNANVYPYADMESWDIIFEAGSNTVKLTNPTVSYNG